MKLAYPIILIPDHDEGGYVVAAPDLPGCVTEGRDLADALYMARDAASGWVLTELEAGRPAPKASDLTDITSDEPGGIVTLIGLDVDEYAAKYGQKAVRRSVMIPAWLSSWADEHGVNCSRVLRDALESQYRGELQEA